MEIGIIIAAAVLVEGLIQYGKTIAQAFETGEKKTGITQLISIIIGVLIAFAFGANAFEVLGMAVNPMIGTFLTGIVISRGSNYASDLLKRIASYARQDLEKMLDTKVNLKVWVKVKEDWQDKDNIVSKFKLK